MSPSFAEVNEALPEQGYREDFVNPVFYRNEKRPTIVP
jgi:hypothetical protein